MRKSGTRIAGLRRMLSERRHELQNDVRSRLRSGRDRPADGRDDLEHSEADTQGDIERSLIQIRAATLERIDEALVRLDAGLYGTCTECESAIAERRLRALPFAVRCQGCEERREAVQGRTQHLAQQRGQWPLFVDGFGS
ncbi:MAG TPA: TraR/DksA C4-type zinc finger protein [Vicinamibacterales bacterium]|nr:TraR/DksA C4-type zinc finger protein [Vicinamibacterales bacterium]